MNESSCEISCKCYVCGEEIEFEGTYRDALQRQRDFEFDHYHSGKYRIHTLRTEKDTLSNSE